MWKGGKGGRGGKGGGVAFGMYRGGSSLCWIAERGGIRGALRDYWDWGQEQASINGIEV